MRAHICLSKKQRHPFICALLQHILDRVAVHRLPAAIHRNACNKIYFPMYVYDVNKNKEKAMFTHHSHDIKRHLIWGVALIAIGFVVLLDRLHVYDIGPLWKFWPVFLIVGGISDLLSYNKARRIADGVFWILTGGWLLAVQFYAWGLTYRNSWPFLLIAWGVSKITRSLLNKYYFTPQTTTHYENGL